MSGVAPFAAVSSDWFSRWVPVLQTVMTIGYSKTAQESELSSTGGNNSRCEDDEVGTSAPMFFEYRPVLGSSHRGAVSSLFCVVTIRNQGTHQQMAH